MLSAVTGYEGMQWNTVFGLLWQTSEWYLVSSQKFGILEAFAFWKEKAMPLAHAHFTPLYWPLAIPHMEDFSQITVFSSHTWRAPGARGHCPVTLA